MIRLSAPFAGDELKTLKAGNAVLLSGDIFTARDAAHKRLIELMRTGSQPPFDLRGAAIYYAGPSPAKPGQAIGSCGPTSAVRMNPYAPVLFDAGVKCTIAKGPVSRGVADSIAKNGAVYLCATGGCGALLSKCVTAAYPVAFPELGTEAIKKLTVKDMPLIVGIDCAGGTLFV